MENIYTIPVNEAFEADCECPICELRKRFETDTINYFVGPSLMEPDTRILTNDVGFCGRHFKLMYDTQANRLGVGLMLDTYMNEQISRLKKVSGKFDGKKKGLFSKNSESTSPLVSYLENVEKSCAVCDKLNYTMDRYLEVFFDLYSHDKDFRAKVLNGKGFCLPHLKTLLILGEKKLSSSAYNEFCSGIMELEIKNLERINCEVNWFTKKFDYRNREADWGNSKDALPRAMVKMSEAKDII